MTRKGIGILFCSLLAATLWAQDPSFSQFYAAPLQLNPAFAGVSYAPRITVNYRLQWPSWPNAYRTFAAAYEQSIEGLNSGFGLSVLGDDAGDGVYQTQMIHGAYGYRLQVNQDLFLKLGFELGMLQTRLDWDRLRFGDQLDPINGLGDDPANPRPSDETQPGSLSRVTWDMGTGLLVYSSRFYAGVSLKHLNRANEGLLNVNQNLAVGRPMRLSLHGGMDIDLPGSGLGGGPMYVSPGILFQQQGGFSMLYAGAYWSGGLLFAGGWFRQASKRPADGVALIGVRHGALRIGYSFDLPIGGPGLERTGGAHEISVSIALDDSRQVQERRRRSQRTDCFRFLN